MLHREEGRRACALLRIAVQAVCSSELLGELRDTACEGCFYTCVISQEKVPPSHACTLRHWLVPYMEVVT